MSTAAVCALIRTGRLRASDVSAGAGGRPGYRITRDDLKAFFSDGWLSAEES